MILSIWFAYRVVMGLGVPGFKMFVSHVGPEHDKSGFILKWEDRREAWVKQAERLNFDDMDSRWISTIWIANVIHP